MTTLTLSSNCGITGVSAVHLYRNTVKRKVPGKGSGRLCVCVWAGTGWTTTVLTATVGVQMTSTAGEAAGLGVGGRPVERAALCRDVAAPARALRRSCISLVESEAARAQCTTPTHCRKQLNLQTSLSLSARNSPTVSTNVLATMLLMDSRRSRFIAGGPTEMRSV